MSTSSRNRIHPTKGKSFFICFSTCLLTFQTQTVKECRLCFKAKRAICHFFIRFVSKIHAWRRGKRRKTKQKPQNHDSMHDFILHHFCIYQTLHFYFLLLGWLDNNCLSCGPQRTLTFWVNETFLNSFLYNYISNDLTKTKQVQKVFLF